MEIYFVTSNPGKAATAERELSELGIDLIPIDLDIPEHQSIYLDKIAAQKAMDAYKKLGKPPMVNDSGSYLDSWPLFPGTMTKHVNQTIGNIGILKMVKDEDRGASFQNSVAYIDKHQKEPVIFGSGLVGHISFEEHGESPGWSKLNRIFIPEGYRATLAEIYENPEDVTDYHEWRISRYPIFRPLGKWLLERDSE